MALAVHHFTQLVNLFHYILQAVGGYDAFFFKNDRADGIAFSLAVWLCGGSVIEAECAWLQSKPSSSSDSNGVTYLQHAKYISQVFGGHMANQFTSPGIEFYMKSLYDQNVSALISYNLILGSCSLAGTTLICIDAKTKKLQI